MIISAKPVCPSARPVAPSAALILGALVAASTPGTTASWADPPSVASSSDAATQDTPTKGARHVIVEGQVLNNIGGGEAGVSVALHKIGDDGTTGELVHETTTNEMGDFQLTAPEPIHADVVVTFTKPQRTKIVRRIHVGDSEWPAYLAEQMEGNLALRGTVRSAKSEAALSGALVTARSAFNEWTVRTDDAGRFSVDGLFPGELQLVVEAEKHGREVVRIDTVEVAGSLEIDLKPERTIEIIVRDDTSEPVSAAIVEVLDAQRDDLRSSVTDNKGHARFSGLHFDADRVTVRVTHADYVFTDDNAALELPKEEINSKHDFTLQRAGFVRGTVRSTVDGKPLYGVRVISGPKLSDATPRDWTDPEGKFEIRGIPPGEVLLTAHLAGYAPELIVAQATAGNDSTAHFKLPPGRTVRGTVVDSDGEPAPNVLIDARNWRGHNTLGLRAMSDADGSFRISDAPSDEFTLVALAPGGAGSTATVRGDAEQPIELKLPEKSGPARNFTMLNVGDEAPSFSATTIDGKPIKLAKLKGKYVVLDFWATWCAPCVEELPHLMEAYEKFGPRKDVEMMGVSLDFEDKALRRFLREREIKWPQIGGEPATKIAGDFGVQGIPALFIVDPDGKIAVRYIPGSQLAVTLEKLTNQEGSGE